MRYTIYRTYAQTRAGIYRLASVSYLTRKMERISSSIKTLQSYAGGVHPDAYDRLADHECDIYRELRRRGIITL